MVFTPKELFVGYQPPYERQEEVSEYLRSGGDCHAVAAGFKKDIKTGETILETVAIRDDGCFTWNSLLAYYVDTYNLRLPLDFESHILSTTGRRL